jgi:hypothetical protein
LGQLYDLALGAVVNYMPLESNVNWIIDNKEWLFSGVAVAIPLAIVAWIVSTRLSKQVQRSGKNSTNIQVGGNLAIKSNKSDEQ